MYPLETWKPEGYTGPPDQKAAAVFSDGLRKDVGENSPLSQMMRSGALLWWDLTCTVLSDSSIYGMFWVHKYGTSEDANNHWIISKDSGRTWSPPRPTNLRGQVCCPIALSDGRIATIYNFRHDPQGIRIALTADLETYDVENELVVFDAGAEASLGTPDSENFLAEHLLIGFGKPGGSHLTR